MSIRTPYNLKNEDEKKSSPLKKLGLAAAVMLGIGAWTEHVAVTYDRNSVRNAIALCTGHDTREEIEACAESALAEERGLLALNEPVGFLSGQTMSDEVRERVYGLGLPEKDLFEPGLVP